MQLAFMRALPVQIQQRLHEDGWTFREQENCYTKQYGAQGPGAAYVEARRYFDRLCKELAPDQGQGIPF
jgi:hypothetical protein